MTQPNQTRTISDGLWANARDSIKHALDHFWERGRPRADRSHHDKWIVLSVHHAAECICTCGSSILNQTILCSQIEDQFGSLVSPVRSVGYRRHKMMRA